ncbi:6,7-dimethyl-8-ribityllumazine synthase [Piscinibacter sp.]|uniref:6,7-dimethyl-8-ribityllumazine synthase n=1 Tax=Piscinibacter sp. TaxID=1903157 RepID=UPI0039E257F6
MNQLSHSPAAAPQPAAPHSRPRRVAIVASAWHRDIVATGTAAMRAELERNHVAPDRIDLFEVPGAFEIPLHAKRLARCGRYDAIIACGLVVNGGIYRHEFVASAVIDALMRVQMETDTPVLSAVLTPRDFHEHADHQRFFREHFVKKGTEAAQACLQTMASLDALPRDGG